MSRTIRNLFGHSKTRNTPKPQKRLAAYRSFEMHLEYLEEREVPANFTAGDLTVLQLGSNTDNTTGTVLELAPTGASQTPALTVPISTMSFSDSGTSGFLSDSNDGTLLTFAAYNTTSFPSGSDLATDTAANARGVGTLNNATTFNLATTYTESTSGDQTRSAATLDNTNYFITDKGGLFTNNATTPSLTTNILVARAFGGTVYVASTKAAAGVSTVSSPTATSLTALPGFPADGNIQDFYLIQSGQNGSTYDILYTVDQSGTGQINKYSLVSGSWVSNGTFALSNSDTAMIAANDGSGGAYLYLVTTSQALANSVVQLTDTAGYNATININSANNVTLYTTSGTTTLKGIAFAPVASGSSAPTITSASNTSINYQNTGSFQVTATGTPTPTYSLSGAPSWVSINNTTGLISFTASQPTETSTTNYTFTIIASNGVGTPASQNFTVNVVYAAPTITSANNTSAYAGLMGTFQVTAVAGPPVTGYSLTGSPPSWATINNTTGLITFTNPPAIATTTGVSFTINVTNAAGTTPQTFTVNDLPTISYSSTSGAAYTQSFSTLPTTDDTPVSGTGTPVAGPYDLTTSSTNAFGASGLTGWYAGNLGSSAEKFGVGNGNATTGAVWAFNDGTPANGLALGTISTSSTAARFGAIFVNNSGVTLSSFNLSYLGEEWREGATDGSGNTLGFSYDIGSTGSDFTGGSFTSVSSLSFSSPQFYGSGGGIGTQLDGTLAANQVAVNGTVNGITWLPGESLVIMWDKGTGASTQDGLGISNVSFTATPSSVATTTAVSANLNSPQVYGTPITFTATITAASGTASPTAGSVDFFDNGTQIGDVTSTSSTGSGFATFTYTTTATQLQVNGGSANTISATYNPGTGFSGSSSSGSGNVSETITPFDLTVSGVTASNKVYDSTTSAILNTSSAALVGVFSGDTVTLSTSGVTGTFAGKDVANGITVTTSGFTIGGAQAGDYSLTQPTTTANITPFGLTISGVTANNKVYNATTTATLNTGSAALVGVFSGDTVTLGTIGATGTFASKDVANGITVTTSGFTLGGAQAGDYSLTQPTTSANITPFGLTVSGLTASNKVYDNTTAATLNTSSASLVGVFSGDTVTLSTSGATGAFLSKDVANGITVSTSGFTVGGAQAGDYSLMQPTTSANITPFGLTISGVTAINKVYDSTTSATLNAGSASLVGVFSGDTVTLGTSGATGTFASKDVANGITVTTSGFTLGGAQAGDYSLTQPTTSANITPFGLSVSGVTASNKVYDSTTSATLNTANASLVGVFNSDTVTLGTSGATGTFASKDVANGITVTTSGFTLGGAQAGDYTLTQPTTSANITPFGLTVSGVTANDKIYDSTTDVTLNTGGASLVGVFNGDTVTLSTSGATGTFVSKDAGTGITVEVSGLTISGTSARDYTLIQPTTSANITPFGLTVSGVTANNKVYDSTTAATLNTSSAALVGVFSGDTVTLSTSGATGMFASKDVANGITVTTSGFTLGGAQAGDYSLPQPTTSANITPFGLTVSGVTANNKVYDSTTSATLNTSSAALVGVFTGDIVTLGTSGAIGTFASKDVANGIAVTTSGFTLGGAQASDYSLTQPTTNANITARPLTVTAVTDTKTYDGSTTSTAVPIITSGALQGGDTADFIEMFDTPSVGTGKTLTPSGTVNDGDGGADYTYTFVAVNTGVILPAATSTTTVTTSQATVTYGMPVTFTATVVASSGTPTGSVEFFDDTTNTDLGAGTLQSASGVTAIWTYTTSPTQLQVTTSPAAQAIRAVYTPTGSISGSFGTLTGGETISPFGLTVNDVTAANKVYDQSTAATLNTGSASLVGVFSGDTVRLDTSSATGTFASPDVGNGITVMVTGLTLSGAQAGDYSLTQPTTTANITTFGLTVSGTTSVNKVYDHTTAATLNTSSAALVGVFSGDTVMLVTSGATGRFASKDVANGITVTTSGFTLDGAQASDYSLTQPTTSANITPFGLTVTGVTANNKVYNASTTATLNTGSASLVGVFSGDTVTLGTSGAIGTFVSKDVANGITVSVTGLTLGGAEAADYTLTQPTTTANITPATLTVTGVSAQNKVYDQSASATLDTAGATLIGVYTGDSVSLSTSGATGTFASQAVGTGLTVTVSGLTISGTLASDYTLTQPTTSANITPLGITVTGVTATNKVYNSTTAATLNTGSATLVGVLSGDTVTLDTSGATGVFSSTHVGTGITVTVSGLTLGGGQAGDYTFTQPTTTANITPLSLTVSGITASNKVYDQTTTATLGTGSASLVGVLSGDTVTLSTGSATGVFASQDVGSGITVAVSGLTLGGISASDYTLTQPTTTASITPRPLTISGITANNMVYDATTVATLNTGSAALVGVLNGDTVSLSTSSATGTFASQSVGTGITVSISSLALSGAQAADYTLSPSSTTADITARPITVTAATNNKTYDGTTSAVAIPTITTGSLATGDTATLSETYNTRNVGTALTLTPLAIILDGNDGNNYAITYVTNTSGVIAARAITVTAAPNSKTSDGTTKAAAVPTITSGSLATGDTAAFIETYDTPTAGTGKTLTPSGTVDDGNGGHNYTITFVATTNGTILATSSIGATQFAVGAAPGGSSVVIVYNPDGSVAYTVDPFPGVTSGLRVAVGDFTGDGTEDVAVGTGPGVPAEVKVVDPSGNVLFDVTPFETFTGGVFVAAGDISDNGKDDLVISPDQGGGPRVLIYSGGNFNLIDSFYGITDPNFRGGARVAVGDINGDGYADVVVAAGDGGGPRVGAWDGKSVAAGNPTKLFNDIYVFDSSLRNGAYVAVGDVNGDGYGDIIAGAGPGGGPRVTIFNGADLLAGQGSDAAVLDNFFAGSSNSRGGVVVASKNLENNSFSDVVTGLGEGGGSVITAYAGQNLDSGTYTPLLSFEGSPASDLFPGYVGGVYVG